MADYDSKSQLALPSSHLITLTHIVYGLHAFSVVSGMASAVTIVTAFLAGWPSIIAVIITYVRRREVRGTFLDSHFSWQLRTFWWALFWLVAGCAIALLFGGMALLSAFTGGLSGAGFAGVIGGIIIIMAIGLWVLYRIARGWLALVSHKPMPM